MSLFVCPICGAALEREPGRYRCPAGHSYDVAREGYTHLLPANRKHSKMPGDDKGMAAARSVFLSKDYYASLRDALCRLALDYAPEHPAVLDTGCGEGYYTSAVYRALRDAGKAPCMAGTDISKAILRRAAKREKDVEFAVASSYHLPVADRSIDLLLNCFSPLALEEFQRALRPGGTFLYVVPSEKHLWELKQVLYDHPYPNEVKETPYEGFAYAEIRHVEDRIRVLGQEDIHALFQMTPYYWKTPKSGCQRLAALEELAGRGAAFRQRLAAITEEKNALEAERTAKNRAGQEMNENLLNLERAVAKLDQKRATSAMEEKQILDRLWEHYELSHSDAQAQRIELESVPKANRRIGELKRDITALGTPNIGAIDEFQRVNTRYTYLTDQRNDVEKAKGELQNIIGEITEEMTKIFAEQFKLLSESFQTTFQELFGGGTARLELEDEEDILGCGIEIKAQPPGKTLKTISLLSGGEKAFVAIALYFSILKVHPTPFCVMDEIEAALDDANVTRYARYMRTLAGRTQFIVITHRRGTMEEADVLYGVTMQEQGVSKILTINLNDMAKELKIK